MTKKICPIIILVASIIFTFSFAACSKSGKALVYDIAQGPVSLDPQKASSPEELLIIANTFDTLLTLANDGSVTSGAAERFDRSDDGLTYTFYIRKDMTYSDGKTPVTASDFVFALQKLLGPDYASPYKNELSCVKNAAKVGGRQLPVSQLGLDLIDDYTFSIQLSAPNDRLPELMTKAYAAPCNKAFFDTTNGKYGSQPKYILSSGPFYIKQAEFGDKITLLKNPSYRSAAAVRPASVALTVTPAPADRLQRFAGRKTCAAFFSLNEKNQLGQSGRVADSFENTVWVLSANCQNSVLSNEAIRTALLQPAAAALDGILDTDSYQKAVSYLPDSIKLLDSAYNVTALPSFPAYEQAKATAGFKDGMAALGLVSLPKLTLIFPDDPMFAKLSMAYQKLWIDRYGAYINAEPQPMDTLRANVQSGGYDLALFPVSVNDPTPLSVLSLFSSGSGGNFTKFSDADYDNMIKGIQGTDNADSLTNRVKKAQELLLAKAPAVPLFYESSYFVTAKDVTGLQTAPFSQIIYFAGGK